MARKTAWNYINLREEDYWETNIEPWNPVEVARCGTDSILQFGYDLRHRWEMEQYADECGLSLEWR